MTKFHSLTSVVVVATLLATFIMVACAVDADEGKIDNLPYESSDVIWVPSNKGKHPSDAWVAGIEEGFPLYVARALIRGVSSEAPELTPGKLFQNSFINVDENVNLTGAVVTWGGNVYNERSYYEVLASPSKNLKWVQSGDGEIVKNAVLGGTNGGTSLHIGRVNYPNGSSNFIPGKVFFPYHLCYITYDGQELSFLQYEVLVTGDNNASYNESTTTDQPDINAGTTISDKEIN